jgi:16S rRNA (cytosine967-C5)-methyltransferase
LAEPAGQRATDNPRLAATLAVADVIAGRSLADCLTARSAGLAPRDRALAAELAYGSCRWFWRLDALLGQLLSKPLKSRDRDVHALLACGLYQLLYTRVPAHAAVGETVAVARRLGKRWAAGLVNGVLRRVQRERAALLARLDRAGPVANYALPGWLVERLRAAWPGQWQTICAHLNERPPMTLRVNPRRSSTLEYANRLAAVGLPASPVAGLPQALVLDRPVDVAVLPDFAAGWVSVQDAGAQRAAALLDLAPGQRVLDACAAPGGKTGHLLELAPGLELIALDVDGDRLARVADNLARLGCDASLQLGDAAAPAAWWDGRPFDRVLLDVPCSATGAIRRHPDIRLLRRADDVADLARRQAAMLEAIWPLLVPGGKLLYVTCSLLPVENDECVGAFAARHGDARALPLPEGWGHARGLGRQLLPGETGNGDGFFYALLQKEST